MTKFVDDLLFSKQFDKQIDGFLVEEMGKQIIINRVIPLMREHNGIDGIIINPNGEHQTFEQKIRRTCKYKNDVAIEFCSKQFVSEQTCTEKGWIFTLSAELLIYGCHDEKSGKLNIGLYPVHFLRKAWFRYSERWRSIYPVRAGETHNPDGTLSYQSYFCAIPVDILNTAISAEQRCDRVIELRQKTFDSYW